MKVVFGLLIALMLCGIVAVADTVYLSDLQLENIAQGYGDPGKDVSVVGERIMIGGRKFAKGIGTHANSVMQIKLDGQAKRFSCYVGVNDTGGNEEGTVGFVVRTLDKELFRSKVITKGNEAVRVDLDVTGLTLLILEANDGGDDINSDHGIWADAVITYEGKKPAIIKKRGYRVERPTHAKGVSVTNFGVRPNSRINAVKAVRAAIEACRGKEGMTVIFPKGRYDFWAQHSEEIDYHESNTTDNNPKICPIVLKGIRDLTIDGNGSEFVFHGRMQPFTLENCEGVTVKNIDIDWDIPFVAQSRIMRVEKEYIEIKLNPAETPYEILGGKIIFYGEGWKSGWWGCMEFENETRIIPQQSGDSPLGGGWNKYKAEELGGGLVRLNHDFKRKPKVGNYLMMRHSARDHSGVFIYRCKDTVFENVNLFTAAGLGFLGQFSENITLRNTNVMPNYAKGRYLCGHADGFQVSNCRGHILVDGCKFEGLMDDPINVHGTSVRILEVKGRNKLLCKFMEGMSTGMTWGGVGNKVGFIENQSMVTVGESTVKALTKIDRDHFEIEFNDDVPEGIAAGDALENLTWAPDFTVRNSVFGSCRARGLLVSTPGNVVIENNDFISSGAAILIAGDANGWYESGAVKDVVIRGNRFHPSCLTSWYQFGQGVISIYPIIPAFDPETPFHRNIRIEGNRFDVFDYSVLYALSVDGLTFNGNTIEHNTKYEPWQGRKAMLTFEGCKNVEVKNNKIADDVLGKNISIVKMDAAEVMVGNGQGIVE